MDLKEFYLQNIQEDEYHYRFHTSIKNVNKTYNIFYGYEETNDFHFEVYDIEEAISKFKELCQPEMTFENNENKCWFYLVTYYLYKMGYEIKEFPKALSRPPVDPRDFTYGEIRNRIIAQGGDDEGTVRYVARRKFIEEFTFRIKSDHINIDEMINKKFIEISNRQAAFNNMSTDEKLAEIANLIENLLKKNDRFSTLDYSKICFAYVTNDTVKKYRKQIQCFRHASEEAIAERTAYSIEQKNFFIDYGLTIVKVIYALVQESKQTDILSVP